MISFHTIGTIARYEMKTLLRAWFFRIFAALAIVSLAIYNIAMFIESSGAPWIYRALPAALPYANLIILNLGQAIVAVFLASEFLKQDKKNDTVEVIYARSMTNSEYILGKSIGILTVFFILNLIVLLEGIAFSFISTDSSREVVVYFIYPLLISLPTLVYMIGLSFFLMIVLKNQAITFILLLGYIALSIFYLNNKYYNLPDFVAYNVPMMHSTVSGFNQITEILIHRGLYFCLGLGLIFFTIFKLARLPQAKHFKSFPLFLSLFFLFLGGSLMYLFVKVKQDKIELKQLMIEINDNYVSYPRVNIDSCYLKLEHQGDEILVGADLIISNQTKKNIDTIILSLNPSLKVVVLDYNGENKLFTRNLQIIKFPVKKGLSPGNRAEIHVEYKGTIDENTHFLDRNLTDYSENFIIQIYSFRKHDVWLQNDFVCLTSESLWYPVSGIGYSAKCPDAYLPDFTSFKVEIKTAENLYAICQGKMTSKSKGNFLFEPENPLSKISLLIGNYQKYSLIVDSIEYSLIYNKGNDYFKNQFTEVKDSLSYLIRELKNEYEARIGFKYPFKRFSLVEVPAEFGLDKHIWSISSDAVQPEIVLIPEKAVYLNESDFRRRKKREEDRMKRDNEEVMPEELQARIFKNFIRNNFLAEADQYYQDDIMDRNSLSLFPEFFTFTTQLNSAKWPILNTALNAYIKERSTEKPPADFWWGENIAKPEQINLELKKASLNQIIRSGITNINKDDGRVTLNELILAKGGYLFSLLSARFVKRKFDTTLDNFLKSRKFQTFNFDGLDSIITESMGVSVADDIDRWYNQINLAGFLIKEVETYKVKENEYTKYQLRFKVSNPEPVDGIITIFVELGNKDDNPRRRRQDESRSDFSKEIYIPANSSREIGFVFPSEPSRMRINTHISENLPNNLIYDFSSFDEIRKTKAIDSVQNIPFFNTIVPDNEFVVDNEDSNFSFTETLNKSYLKSIIDRNSKNIEGYKYSRIRSWNPPGRWKPVLQSEFYGKYVRSAIYTKAGTGDRVAVWKANLQKAGSYDIYFNIVKITNQWRRDKERINYNFKVYHDEGVETINLLDEDIEQGWVYIGTFYVSPENARVELSNKSIGNMVFADAVKWVQSR